MCNSGVDLMKIFCMHWMPTQVIEVGSGSYLCHTDVMKCNVVYYEIQCKKKKGGGGIIECDKSMVISDVGTV